ncbi:MAG: hypothetical protein LBV27_11175 [Oscillospiraceae bacterium]|jgi:hypothetical protein|nr:hypothetical protein [Oscillospiraceae bacterium]
MSNIYRGRTASGESNQTLLQIAQALPRLRQEVEHAKKNRAGSMDAIKGVILTLLAFLEAMIATLNNNPAANAVKIKRLQTEQARLLNEYLRIANAEEEGELEASDHQISLVEKIMAFVYHEVR